jgi:DDE superfamily endonuclease
LATRHTLDCPSRPGLRAKKKRRDRLIQRAANHPDLVLGFEADVWGSREAQPHRPAWSDDKPVRLVEKTVPAQDPEGNAGACDGLSGPTAHHRLLRFVRGRPVSLVPCAFLAWLATDLTAPGKRALVLLGDKAAWHVSQAVQAWITAHHRHAKQEGGCRLMVCRLPSKSPWLNPIEPKWVHGKRAVVEPARVLSMTDLMQRVCAYYECELTDPIAQPDC